MRKSCPFTSEIWRYEEKIFFNNFIYFIIHFCSKSIKMRRKFLCRKYLEINGFCDIIIFLASFSFIQGDFKLSLFMSFFQWKMQHEEKIFFNNNFIYFVIHFCFMSIEMRKEFLYRNYLEINWIYDINYSFDKFFFYTGWLYTFSFLLLHTLLLWNISFLNF